MKKTEMRKISLNVRIYRAKHKITQAKFGELFGVSAKTVSNIEKFAFNAVGGELLQIMNEFIKGKRGV